MCSPQGMCCAVFFAANLNRPNLIALSKYFQLKVALQQGASTSPWCFHVSCLTPCERRPNVRHVQNRVAHRCFSKAPSFQWCLFVPGFRIFLPNCPRPSRVTGITTLDSWTSAQATRWSPASQISRKFCASKKNGSVPHRLPSSRGAGRLATCTAAAEHCCVCLHKPDSWPSISCSHMR